MAGMMTGYLNALLGRAREYLEPEPELVFIAPGESVAWDNCCGQLWARIVEYRPVAGARPTRKADGTLCAPRRQAQIEIGVLRCVATVDDHGNFPTGEEMTADSEQLLADAEAIWQMLSCEVGVREIIRWSPHGPQGGCAGGTWTFTVDMGD